MGIFARLFQQKTQNKASSNLPSTVANSQSSLTVNSKPDIDTRLRELEKELNQVQVLETKPLPKPKGNLGKKLIWTTILIGIPIGILYLVNLPYPAIRRPVAKVAPFLLLPSQISIDNNFKQSITLIEQAKQLIENATSSADIDLGEQKLQEGKEYLNAIPITSGNEWSGHNYGWYNWNFSWGGFQQLRGQVGQLEAKVFQEKNAQALLVEGELALNTAKTQYQQSKTPTDKRVAIKAWQSSIDQLEQIPSVTIAGKNAQQKLNAYQREFQEVVGLAANNEKVTTLITSAQQFSRKAAQRGQNPPHNVEYWSGVEKLWEMAINNLDKISENDLDGYAKAQELKAEYTTNLEEIRLRKQDERDSLNALESAQNQIERLLANIPTEANSSELNRTISEMQGIINELDKVKNGTTSYLKAQELKYFAKNKLQQLQSKSP